MDIVALQETRWPLAGKINTKGYVIYYSGNNEGRYYGGVGFAVKKKWSPAVMEFSSFDERMCNIRIRGRFRNMSLCSIYAPTEEAEEEVKDIFYDTLEELVTKLPNYDLKIILGDANSIIGKEDTWKEVAGKHSLHEKTNDNGVRLLSFCEATNSKVMSTAFPHKNIHKQTWVSPNGIVKNQIDHAMIDQRQKSSILDVYSLRAAECGTDHYLVLVKVRQRIAVVKSKVERACERQAVEILKTKKGAEEFKLKLTNRFKVLEESTQGNELETNLNQRWETLKQAVQETAKEVCGKKRKVRKNLGLMKNVALKLKKDAPVKGYG
ncbi:hypothetical protein J6590_108848 [Homalodisca vitripennis]|nr:hypothetical protein J6590_108848 [Homalodisca vitripennis]